MGGLSDEERTALLFVAHRYIQFLSSSEIVMFFFLAVVFSVYFKCILREMTFKLV